MPVQSYQDVTWGEEEVTPGKLNAMVSNSQWLHEHLPTIRFNGYHNARRELGVKIAAGTVLYPKTSEMVQRIRVEFGDIFTPNCTPVITTAIASNYNGRIIETFYGFRGEGYVPLHDGFIARLVASELNPKVNYFIKSGYLHWIAVGY